MRPEDPETAGLLAKLVVGLLAILGTVVACLVAMAKKVSRRKDRTTDRILIAPASSGEVARLSEGIVTLGDRLESTHAETSQRLAVIGGQVATVGTEVERLRDWRHDTANEVASIAARLIEGDRRIGDIERRLNGGTDRRR